MEDEDVQIQEGQPTTQEVAKTPDQVIMDNIIAKGQRLTEIEENVVDGDPQNIRKEDWFQVRLDNPSMSTDNLSNFYGADNFNNLKSAEEYWKKPEVQEKFNEMYGMLSKIRFNDFYDHVAKEFSLFQIGNFQSNKTSSEIFYDSNERLKTEVLERFQNLDANLQFGDNWSAPRMDLRENFEFAREWFQDANGNITFEYNEYSAGFFQNIMDRVDGSIGGLAYGDIWNNSDPREGVSGVFFDVIKDGLIYDDASGELVDVRNDQVVSRWDIETGSWTDGLLKNNKLEADGILDYAKTIIKAPINMAANLLDVAIQVARASTALTYGAINLFSSEELDVRKSNLYKSLTTAGIQLKSRTTSMSREAMEDGFFGSLEAQLSTIFDIALQVGIARALGAVGSGATRLTSSLTGRALAEAQRKVAGLTVRTTLTALAAKDSYNDAIANGFSTSEAGIISAVTIVALWQATRFAAYITGEYDIKKLRSSIKSIIKTEQKDFLAPAFAKLEASAAAETSSAAAAILGENKAIVALKRVTTKVNGLFEKVSKNLPSGRVMYEARQESLEEMTEELYQDLVKHGASAYGVLMNDAHEAGKGRYITIFDEGYFKDFIERYGMAGIAGGIGGPMGMIGRKGNTSTITATSTVVDIVVQGREVELMDVLSEMKEKGELGPTTLSTEFNNEMNAFMPYITGQDGESLGGAIYNKYEQDVNIIKSFMGSGLRGQAMQRLQSDEVFRGEIDNISVRKDYIKYTSELFDLFTKTQLPYAVLEELDDLSEEELDRRIPKEVEKISTTIKAKEAEIKLLEKKLNKKSATDPKEEGETVSSKSKLKAEAAKKLYEDKEKAKTDKLEMLNRSLSTLKEVTDQDIYDLFYTYRKIRAIANGTAAEYYLLQQDLYEDDMFGSYSNRADEWEDLGDNPFVDLMNKATFRVLDDKKIHLQQVRVAKDNTSTIRGITEISEESINTITNISEFEKEALEHVVKIYKPKEQLKEFLEIFNLNGVNSILTGADYKKDKTKVRELFRQILALEPTNAQFLNDPLVDFYLNSYLNRTNADSKFFEAFVKDPDAIGIPIFSFDEEDKKVIVSSPKLKAFDLISTMDNPSIRKSFDKIDTNVLKFRDIANRFKTRLLDKNKEYISDSFIEGNIDVIFRTIQNGSFTDNTLLETGLDEVRDLISNPRGKNRYSKTNSNVIDNVLEQIKVRDRMASVFSRFYKGGVLGHYTNMLHTFRKNVIDIIDRIYDVEIPHTSTEEVHTYKDYTTLSDFFVDFLYDPVVFKETIENLARNTTTDIDKARIQKFTDSSVKLETHIFKDDAEVAVTMDYEAFYLFLNSEGKFNNLEKLSDIENAIEFFDFDLIRIPGELVGMPGEEVALMFEGITKLNTSVWLLNKAKEYITAGERGADIPPYVEDKNINIEETFASFNALIGAPGMDNLKEYVEKNIPEYTILSANILNKKQDFVALGKMNIIIEKLLFDVFHTDMVELSNQIQNQEQLKSNILEHISEIYFNITKVKENYYDVDNESKINGFISLLGATTTDFTRYYQIFKSKLQNFKEKDDLVISSQERAAKYASAFSYSKDFRIAATSLIAYEDNHDYINTIFIAGAAGSGKSSATIKTGLEIAVEILGEQENSVTAVQGVANNIPQIKIIEGSIGENSKGKTGKDVIEFYTLLNDAVVNKNTTAIEELKTIGIIVFDEVTYVPLKTKNGNEASLINIDKLLATYNKNYRKDSNEMVMISLGDPSQSGATYIDTDGSVYNNSLNQAKILSLNYMRYSFRARNSFLIGGISIIQSIEKTIGNMNDPLSFREIIIPKITRYGTNDGRLYGLNITKNKDSVTNASLISTLSDDILIEDMERNLKSDKEFNIIISPESMVEFEDSLDGLVGFKALLNNPEYAGRVSIIPNAIIGGSEANYVIGELPHVPGRQELPRTQIMYSKLNTLATRGKNYVHVIVKEPDIIVPNESKPIKDGEVVVPEKELDLSAKIIFKDHYLKILENVDDTEPVVNAGGVESSESSIATTSTFEIVSKDIDTLFRDEEAPLHHSKIVNTYGQLSTNGMKISYNQQSLISIIEFANKYLQTDEAIILEEIRDAITILKNTGDVDDNLLNSLDSLSNLLGYIEVNPSFAKRVDVVNDLLAEVSNIENKLTEINANTDSLDISIGNDKTYNDFIVAFYTNLEESNIFKNDAYGKDSIKEFYELSKKLTSNSLDQKEKDLYQAYLKDIVDKVFIAISSDKVITFETLNSDIYTIVNSIILEKAIKEVKPEPIILDDLNVNDDDYKTISFKISTLEVDELRTLSGKIDTYITNGSQGDLDLPGFESLLHPLFDNYNKESVLKAIQGDFEYYYKEKSIPTDIEIVLKEIRILSKEVNIDINESSDLDIDTIVFINNKLPFSELAIIDDGRLDEDPEKIADLAKISRLKESLATIKVDTTKSSKFGTIYMRPNGTSLEEYIKQAESRGGRFEIFTVKPSRFAQDAANKYGFIVADSSIRKEIFGYSNLNSGNVSNVRIVFSKYGDFFNAYVVVKYKRKDYIVSQIQSSAKGITEDFIKKAKLIMSNSNNIDIVGKYSFLVYNVKDRDVSKYLGLRAGGVVFDSEPNTTVSSLEEKGIMTSKTAYKVNSSKFGLSKGTYFYLYTTHKGIDLNDKSIIDQVLGKKTLEQNVPIIVKYKGVNVTVGILPFKNFMTAENMREYGDFKIVDFPSDVSYILQAYILDLYSTESNTEIVEVLNDLRGSYNKSMGIMELILSTEHSDKIDARVQTIKKSSSFTVLMNTLAKAFIENSISTNKSEKNILYKKSKAAKAPYVFNMDKALSTESSKLFNAIDSLIALSGWKFPIPAEAQNFNKVYLTMDKKFTNKLNNKFKTPVKEVSDSEIVLKGKLIKELDIIGKKVKPKISTNVFSGKDLVDLNKMLLSNPDKVFIQASKIYQLNGRAIEDSLDDALVLVTIIINKIESIKPTNIDPGAKQKLDAFIIGIQDKISELQEKDGSKGDLIPKNILNKFNEYNKTLMNAFKLEYAGDAANVDYIISALSGFGNVMNIAEPIFDSILNNTKFSEAKKISIKDAFNKALKKCN